MRRIQYFSALLVLVSSGIVGCTKIRQLVSPAKASIMLTEADGYKELELNRGDKISVRLVSLPSAGYSWELVKPLKLMKEVAPEVVHEPQKPGPQIVGAAEHESFGFEAVKPGKETIRLRYRRPWEKKSDDERQWSVNVVIN